jgi:hypothetical protein
MNSALQILLAGLGFGVALAALGGAFGLAIKVADRLAGYDMGPLHFCIYALTLGVGLGSVGAVGFLLVTAL